MKELVITGVNDVHLLHVHMTLLFYWWGKREKMVICSIIASFQLISLVTRNGLAVVQAPASWKTVI
jgi:hypothetical protein